MICGSSEKKLQSSNNICAWKQKICPGNANMWIHTRGVLATACAGRRWEQMVCFSCPHVPDATGLSCGSWCLELHLGDSSALQSLPTSLVWAFHLLKRGLQCLPSGSSEEILLSSLNFPIHCFVCFPFFLFLWYLGNILLIQKTVL